MKKNRYRSLFFLFFFGLVGLSLTFFFLSKSGSLSSKDNIKTIESSTAGMARQENEQFYGHDKIEIEEKLPEEKIGMLDQSGNIESQGRDVKPSTHLAHSSINSRQTGNISKKIDVSNLDAKLSFASQGDERPNGSESINLLTSDEEIKVLSTSGNQKVLEGNEKAIEYNSEELLSISQEKKQIVQRISLIPSSEIVGLEVNPIPIKNSLDYVKLDYKSACALYGEISYGFPIRSNLFGSSFAFGIEKSIARRWNLDLGAGLSYSKYNSDIANILNDREQLDAGEFSSGDPVTYVPSQVESVEDLLGFNNAVKAEYYEFVANKLNTLLFIDIPVRLSYRLDRSNTLSFGLQYSYLLNASNEKIFGISSNLILGADQDLEESAFYDLNFLNKNNFAISGRYEYCFNQQLSTYVSYQHGLRSIINTIDKSATRRYKSQLNIGVRYRLKM